MKKRILLTIVVLLIIGGILAGIKALQIRHLIAAGSTMTTPPATLSTATFALQSRVSVIYALPSLAAMPGVTVAP